ncbi:MAG: hypothetical protein M3Q07_11615 [Pseudobdellovibrionaceae bacterium]|nr:hypothetical protein [Pseudobdellovibrionaceae bacterium]
MTDDSERQSVIQRLQKLREQTQTIMDIIADKKALTPHEKSHAQGLYRELKEHLKEEYKSGSSNRGQAAMTNCEQAFYHPAVHQASCELRSATNTNPLKWHDELYGARMQFDYMLNQLEK